MTDQTIIDDALHLCVAALRDKKRDNDNEKQFFSVHTISIENATYVGSAAQLSAVNIFYSQLQTPDYLERKGIIKISPHQVGATIPTNPKGYLLVTFNLTKTQEFVDTIINQNANARIISIPPNWKWFDEKEGIYQFGEKKFQQEGETRKKVFQALMNIFQSNDEHIISVGSLHQMTDIKKERLRIEIDAINARLLDHKIQFQSDKKGYYYLVSATNQKLTLT